MIPKSMAPTDKRFAESPRMTRIIVLKKSANGMVAETMSALRRSPRNIHWMKKTSTMPKTTLWSTVRVVTSMSSRRS